jgi:uncharacterized membrane protein
MQSSTEGKGVIAMETDRLVDDYLRRLEAAAAHLGRPRRAELVLEIREHIETALREEDAASEAAVRNVLERLGPPEEIVEAVEIPPEETRAGTRRLETAAIVALLVPFLGWLVGAALVMLSRAWSAREKLVGLALLVLALVIPAVGFVIGSSDGVSEPVRVGAPDEPTTSTGDVEVAFMFLVFAIGLPSAVYFAWRLRRETATAA